MNIIEVARRAKVSTATASRALNGISTVAPILARRVRRVAIELGYVPNSHARALVKGRSNLLALIVPEITNPFFPEVVQAFESMAASRGYDILLTTIMSEPKGIEASIRRTLARSVDGIAILTMELDDLLTAQFQHLKVPLVLIDASSQITGVSSIRVDYMHGIRQAVQHLAALRHNNIAYIAGPRELGSALARKAAFGAAVAELGRELSPVTILAGDHSIEGGTRALKALLALSRCPTAIVCSNDATAIGVMREAKGRISIPTELSIVGLDDIPLSRFTTPPLTTVRISQSELGHLAFKALDAALDQKTCEQMGNQYILKTELMLRATTAICT